MKPSILFIVPADYDELKEKGVEGMIFERDEHGFFEKVITVHPVARKTQTIHLNACHEVHEFGLDLVAGARGIKFLRVIQYPFQFFRVAFAVIKLSRAHRISLIRANDPYWMGLLALLGSRVCGIPFCVSIHADYDRVMRLDPSISMSTVLGSYKLAKLLSRMVLARAALILPIRETLREKLIEGGITADRVRVIPHGIDLTYFRNSTTTNFRARFHIGKGKRILSFVGRLSKENYIDDVLEITRRLGALRDDIVVVIAGGGKEEARIKALIESDKVLTKCVLMTGFQPQSVCKDLRKDSDVSLCLMAGFSLIEACAAGSPVISYDVEWHYELVKSEETGFLIQEGNIDQAVAAINWLLDHESEAAKMGANARRLAFARHDKMNTSAIKVRCYEEVLALG